MSYLSNLIQVSFFQKSSLKQKIQFCIDICHGMNFITDSGIVHEDLAARNCVYVDNKYVEVPPKCYVLIHVYLITRTQ